eukprot:g40703.t1
MDCMVFLGKAKGSGVCLLINTFWCSDVQKLKHDDQVQKVGQCWSEVMDKLLCDCLESADWPIFKYSVANPNVYATNVTGFIMNQKIHSLLKSRFEAFKMDVTDQCEKSRIGKFANGTKIGHVVDSVEDSCKLPNDIDGSVEWTGKWQMEINSGNCE